MRPLIAAMSQSPNSDEELDIIFKYSTSSFFREFSIVPPDLVDSNTPVDVRRLQLLTKIFDAVPIFNNAVGYTVEELLVSLNLYAGQLKGSLNSSELKILLFSKLSPQVLCSIERYGDKSLKEIYHWLMNMYSSEPTQHEAINLIVEGKVKHNSLLSFTEYTMKLLNVTKWSDSMKSNLLVNGLKYILKPKMYEKVLDFCLAYEWFHSGNSPSVQQLLEYVFTFKTEIDAFLSGQNVPVASVDAVDHSAGPGNSQPAKKKACRICKKTNHHVQSCYWRNPCHKCGFRGCKFGYCKRSAHRSRDRSHSPTKDVPHGRATQVYGTLKEESTAKHSKKGLNPLKKTFSVVKPVFLHKQATEGPCLKQEKEQKMRKSAGSSEKNPHLPLFPNSWLKEKSSSVGGQTFNGNTSQSLSLIVGSKTKDMIDVQESSQNLLGYGRTWAAERFHTEESALKGLCYYKSNKKARQG